MADPAHVAAAKQGANALRKLQEEFKKKHSTSLRKQLGFPFDLGGAELASANLSNAILGNANLCGAKLSGAILNGADLEHANLSGADLSGADLRGARLCRTHLEGANLRRVNLEGADLTSADLRGANLLGAAVDSTTELNGLKLKGTTVDHFTAEYMRDSLTHGQRMDLIIVDDLATLRAEFSGVWGAVHLLGVVVFLLPYLWFLVEQVVASKSLFVADSTFLTVEQWADAARIDNAVRTTDGFKYAAASQIGRTAAEWRARFNQSESKEITILSALCRYVWNGGQQWREGYSLNPGSLIRFSIVGLYNILRLILLWKTKRLETEESVRRLPVRFSLGTGFNSWQGVYKFNRIGYWITLLLIAYNTYSFMLSPIRI